MVQSKKIILLVVLVMLLSVQTVSGVPPVQTSVVTDNNLELKYPSQQFLQVNQTHDFEIHIFNSSTGMPITSAINCTIHLYNSTGKHIWEESKTTFSHLYDVGFTVGEGNFSQLGTYAYIIQCNTTNAGGYIDVPLQVTYTGTELTTATSILNLGFLVLLIFIFILTVTAVTLIGDNESKDDYGQLLSLDNLKYFKGVLVAFSYGLLIAVFFTASNIALAYLSGTMFGNLLFILYKILGWLSIPFVIVWLVWLFVNIFRDKEMQNLINRGIGGEQI